MGKGFLDRIEDAFGAETLADVIPTNIPQVPVKQVKVNQPKRVSKRKKRFLENIDESFGKASSAKKRGKKSFLDTIEEALEDHAFDDLFPTRKQTTAQKISSVKPEFAKNQFNILLTTEVLRRARQIAKQKAIPVQDVINIALQRYIEQEERGS